MKQLSILAKLAPANLRSFKCGIVVMVALLSASAGLPQDLSEGEVKITLDQALPIALKDARERFPDLGEYLLYSASPRVLKGDKKGLFWQFLWQEKAFPHDKGLTVRVYMTDSSTVAERWEKGTYEKENDRPLKP
jgi:hypothetical protein